MANRHSLTIRISVVVSICIPDAVNVILSSHVLKMRCQGSNLHPISVRFYFDSSTFGNVG